MSKQQVSRVPGHPRPCFRDEQVDLELRRRDGLREFLSDPVNCPIRVKDILQLHATVGEDLQRYSGAHFLDGRFRHVCKCQPCGFTHPGFSPICKSEATGDLKPLVPNMHLLVQRVLKPWTACHQVSYAGALVVAHAADSGYSRDVGFVHDLMPGVLFKKDGGWRKAARSHASVFVSHSWQEKFEDFVKTIGHSAGVDELAWVCAFAINQNTPIGKTLGDGVLDSPFARALALADRFLVFMDTSASTLDRVWCVLEAHLALQASKPFNIAVPADFEDAAWQNVQSQLTSLDVRKAEASVASDKEKIMDSIRGQEEFINRAVQRRAMMSCQDGILANAARLGAVEQLQRRRRPFCADAGKHTVLHYAAQAATAQALQWLLESHADPHARNLHGETPLHHAVLSPTAATIAPLVVARAAIHARDASKFGWTPLLKAAQLGSQAAVELLLSHWASVSTPLLLSGCTPLHVAAQAGHRTVVRCLLDASADCKLHAGQVDREISFVMLRCGTPMHHAARNGHTSVIGELLASRAEVEAAIRRGTSRGCTPLHSAAVGGHAAAAQALIRLRANPSRCGTSVRLGGLQPLHCAAGHGHREVAQVLLEARAEVGAQCTSWYLRGEQPLHKAGRLGHAEVAQALLEGRADAGAQCTSWLLRGVQPLTNASLSGHCEVARMLLDARASSDAEAASWFLRGVRALHAAAFFGHGRVVQVLLEARAEVGAPCTSALFHGTQPLHSAAHSGCEETTLRLLEARAEVGARVTSPFFRGTQPIHTAVYHGSNGSLRALLAARAEVGAQATMYMKPDQRPLQIATRQGHTETMRMLLQAGAGVEYGSVPHVFSKLFKRFNAAVQQLDN